MPGGPSRPVVRAVHKERESARDGPVSSDTQAAHQPSWTLVALLLIPVHLPLSIAITSPWEASVKSSKWLRASCLYLGGRGRRATAVQEVSVTPGSTSNTLLTSPSWGAVKALSRLSAQGSVILVHINEH